MKTVKGDLIKLALDGKFDVIVHGCNCFCTMGKGIAVGIKKEFPTAYKADQETVKGDKSKLGTITHAERAGVVAVNAYTQYKYWEKGTPKKRHVDYDAIRSCFKRIVEKWGGEGSVTKFGIPLIGAGLAGGDWEIISKIIEEETHGEDITLVEYDPNA